MPLRDHRIRNGSERMAHTSSKSEATKGRRMRRGVSMGGGLRVNFGRGAMLDVVVRGAGETGDRGRAASISRTLRIAPRY